MAKEADNVRRNRKGTGLAPVGRHGCGRDDRGCKQHHKKPPSDTTDVPQIELDGVQQEPLKLK